jgi:hypothetical protein
MNSPLQFFTAYCPSRRETSKTSKPCDTKKQNSAATHYRHPAKYKKFIY